MRRLLIALLGLGVLAGCTGSAPADTEAEGTVLDIQHVQPEDTTHSEADVRMVREGGQDRVRLEVYAGKQPTGGYSAAIEEVRRVDDTIIVDAVVTTPDEDAVVTQAFTYPADAVTFSLESGAYRVRLHLKQENATRTLEQTIILR